MSHRDLRTRRQTIGNTNSTNQRKRTNGFRRTLAFEMLETRQMLSITPLQSASWSQDTGEKPQSKVFEYAGQWWTVMPGSSGTSVFRLSGTSWTASQQIASSTSYHADVKLVGDLAHVLLYNGTSSQLASLQYNPANNRFEPWASRPQLVNVPLSSGVETATIDVDSPGRMWVASDASSTVEVRYSDGLYSSWSAPITIGSNITSDDISAIIAMPNHSIGVLWSNQNSDRFGFRVHQDDAAPTTWSADEVPASQSALKVGGGMADDHVHLAVAADGTLYAAVKTSYDSSGYPKIALLVRRPNGVWDNLYSVDNSGTRPIVVLDEVAGNLIVAYTSSDGGGDILYRESPLGNISLGPRQTLMSGSLNNVTSTKRTSTNQIVFLAGSKGAIFTYDTAPPTVVNLAPVVNGGPDLSGALGSPLTLDATVTDDGLPSPPSLVTSWTMFSGPGSVTFGNGALVDTTANFSAVGTYVLRLTANDGLLSRSDDVTVNITNSVPPSPPSSNPVQITFQDGLFPSASYAGTRDTWINSGSSSTNYGNSQTVTVDGSPDNSALLKWTLSGIPTGSVIVSASIELNVTNATGDHYEVYALQRAWDELSANWQQYASGQKWAGSGANGGGDHGSIVLGKIGPASTGLYRIALNSAGVAAVQGWLNNPTANYGIILQNYSVSDKVDFSSSEVSNTSLRPKLIITYQPNLPPLVDAGPSQTIQFGTTAVLIPTISDDGKPVDSLLTALWSVVSGPSAVTFGSATSASTTAQFGAVGVYKLRITVSDGVLNAFDELDISVV